MNNKLACMITTLCLSISLPLYADNEDYSNQDVSGMDFSRKSMQNSNWQNANATNTDFQYTKLQNADFSNANLTGCTFKGQSNLTLGYLSGANFSNAIINNCNFNYSDFNFDQLSSTKSYKNKDLSGVGFAGCDFSNGNFLDQNLTKSIFRYAVFTNADFTNAILNGADFTSVKGFTKWQLYSTKSYELKDLSKFTFSFYGADSSTFVGSEFGKYNLKNTAFRNVNFTSSNFANADLSNGSLLECTLDGSNFMNANLSHTSLRSAKLSDVNFNNAYIEYTDFSYSNLTKERLYTTKSYKNKNLTGIKITNVKGWDFTGQNLNSACFRDMDETTVFTDAVVSNMNVSNFTIDQLYSTKSFKDKDLSGVIRNNAEKIDLSGFNLTNATIGIATYNKSQYSQYPSGRYTEYDTDLTDAIINGATIKRSIGPTVNGHGVGSYDASYMCDKIYSTKSYKDKNLSGVKFVDVKSLDGINLSDQNIMNVSFGDATLDYAYFYNSDFRGGGGTWIQSSKIYTKNTIWTDGEIKSFNMKSSSDYLLIRKYIPATTGGAMINAKIVDDATISGGAVLTLEEGAVLEVSAGKTLTVSDNGEIVFDVDAATDDTNIILNSGSKLVFGDNSKFTINLTGEVSETDPLLFTVIKAADDSYVLGLDTLPKDNIILNVNGTAYDTSKWGINFNPTTGTLDINVNVPEPASIATIFAALALGLAAYRRRK